ncbi:Ig-like domain-containing protein [Butyrivibrio sp. INlla16]|uniref:Ig-like domain-containing protein n=1 Tax=Butyrivibrio sp. INlla16 TaxID=1520807 RepID=UPI0008833916|nr:Ig-like domain-containing protein [Butyrivibrio sp. INlla16]SDB50621.1 Fibronectin type III domain-containing protein [Butyrivibrio sp. INlla16]
MEKRGLLHFIILVAVIFLLSFVHDNARAATSGGFTYEVQTDGTAKITECTLNGNIVIPESLDGHRVTKLQPELFMGKTTVTSVHIPSGVKAFGMFDYIFSYCYRLKAITVSSNNNELCAVNGVLYSKDMSILYNYPCGKTAPAFYVPETVTDICCTAFASTAIGSPSGHLEKLYLKGINTTWYTYTFYGDGNLKAYYKNGGDTEAYVNAGRAHAQTSSIDHNYPVFTLWDGQITPTTAITINKTAMTLKEGAHEEITAQVYPANATSTEVEWISSNEEVAEVYSGTVYANTAGTAIITAKTVDGTAEASCKVTVLPFVKVSELKLSKKELELKVGKSEQLIVNIVPSDADNKNVEWKSLDPDIASVDQNGIVTAHKVGDTVITVSTEDKQFKDTCEVFVVEDRPEVFKTSSKPQINEIKGKRKGFTVKWSRVSKILGYEIQYSTNKNLKNAKTKKVKAGKQSVTIKKLKSKKTYYVRVRAYSTETGDIIYSKWSAKKKVKTK